MAQATVTSSTSRPAQGHRHAESCREQTQALQRPKNAAAPLQLRAVPTHSLQQSQAAQSTASRDSAVVSQHCQPEGTLMWHEGSSGVISEAS